MIPYRDATGRTIGYATKDTVHRNGYWHQSAVVVVRNARSRILVTTRGLWQDFPGLLDLPGGHEDTSDGGSALENGIREVTEELELTDSGQVLTWDRTRFRVLGAVGCLVADSPTNRERSSLIGVWLPEDAAIQASDDDQYGRRHLLESRWFSLHELETLYAHAPHLFADGLGRVLALLTDDAAFRREVIDFVNGPRWIIAFECQPGCGCSDNDFYAEHSFTGTYEAVVNEAERISYERYRGDFRWSAYLVG